MSSQQFTDRWTGEWAKEHKKIVRAIKRRKSLDNLGLATTPAGKIDLRGFKLPEQTPRWQIKNIQFENVDFSGAQFSDTNFRKCTFSHCLFEKTSMENVWFEAVKILDCDFQETQLYGMQMYHVGKDAGEIQRTIFRKADLTWASFSFPIINETRFDHCRLNDADFDSARLSNCTFKGRIKRVFFRGYSSRWKPGFRLFRTVNYKEFPNPMLNMDFTECQLHDINFTHGIDLSTCRFPASGNFIVIKDIAKVYIQARQEISDTWKDPERALYIKLIDEAYYNDNVREQKMDVLLYDEDEKEFSELIRRINDGI